MAKNFISYLLVNRGALLLIFGHVLNLTLFFFDSNAFIFIGCLLDSRALLLIVGLTLLLIDCGTLLLIDCGALFFSHSLALLLVHCFIPCLAFLKMNS